MKHILVKSIAYKIIHKDYKNLNKKNKDHKKEL